MLALYNLISLQDIIYMITGWCCNFLQSLAMTITSQSFLNPEYCTVRLPLTLPVHPCEDHYCPAFSFLWWIMGYFGLL